MKNAIYRGIIKPAGQSPDGETPDVIHVTKESNGWAIWRENFEDGLRLIEFEPGHRDWMIKRAVEIQLHAQGFSIVPTSQLEGGAV